MKFPWTTKTPPALAVVSAEMAPQSAAEPPRDELSQLQEESKRQRKHTVDRSSPQSGSKRRGGLRETHARLMLRNRTT